MSEVNSQPVPKKPLGKKAYGSIGHLPHSRRGPGDHAVPEGQAKICCEKVRDKHDQIIIQEKLDGSCVAVALIEGVLHPLGRAGWPAESSPYEQHKLFAQWVWHNEERFREVLQEGERIVGEWMAQAHGTRYRIDTLFEPFSAFDIMRGDSRMTWDDFVERTCCVTRPLNTARLIHKGPLHPSDAVAKIVNPWCLDDPEGVVYRVERKNKVDFLAKYVRPDKVDGTYLPEVSGKEAVWNWRPEHSG